MSMLLPPQMLNTIVPDRAPDLDGVLHDPVRRYMVPLRSDRVGQWPSHPHAERDSLHEQEMWLVEGLTQVDHAESGEQRAGERRQPGVQPGRA